MRTMILFFLLVASCLFCESLHGQINRITADSIEPARPSIDKIKFIDESGGMYTWDRTYYDGLGNPIQIIEVDGSPAGNSSKRHIVTPIVYDDMLRDDAKTLLPFVDGGNSASFRENALTDQTNYYNDGFAYTEQVYEKSPLNHVKEIWQPGNVFRTHSKKSNVKYNTNKGYIYRLAFDESTLTSDGSTYYPAGSLSITTVIDEDGLHTSTYTNSEGKVVYEAKDPVDSEYSSPYLDVYYVYDDLGRLRQVLTPMMRDYISIGEVVISESIQACHDYCYFYNYDGKNRLTDRHIPDKGREMMVYDSADRVVMMQDEVMRENSRWLMIRYDAFGREVGQTMIVSDFSRDSLQVIFDSGNTLDMESLYSDPTAYFLSETKYDRLSSADSLSLPFMEIDSVVSLSDYDPRTKTFMVYERKTILDGSESTTSMIERAYYYDYKGRVIQVVERNHLGGISRQSTKYDFTGNIIANHESHQVSQTGAHDVLHKTLAYDPRGRLMRETSRLNDCPTVAMKYDYGDKGELTEKTFQGPNGYSTWQSYSYHNVQGWVDIIMSEYAEMYPSYILNSTTPGHKSSFSGRVSQWTLYDYNEAATHEYKFNYDFAGRLTDSDHTLRLSNGTVREGLFSENDIYYDENGNAYYLQRYSDGDLAEDYTFWYAGNKPVSVRNTGTDNPGTYTYEYDSNGNMTIDGRKSLKLEYNYLNLVGEVISVAFNLAE